MNKMKTKLAVILSSVMIILMTGCREDDKNPITTQSPSAMTSNQPDNMILTGMDIKYLLEKQEINLQLAGDSNKWILNGIKAENYYFSCSASADCKNPLGLGISIYIFKSQQEREKGYEDFNKQKKKNKNIINVPIIWAKTNVLILYWHGTQLNQEPTYEDKITKALNGWEKIRPSM
jgi:hypothetical protein